MSIADSQERSLNEYFTEMLEQAVRADELNCSLKDTVDLYERTMIEKGTAEEVESVEEPSIDKMFERTLAKLRPDISESEEHKMLSRFLSQLQLAS